MMHEQSTDAPLTGDADAPALAVHDPRVLRRPPPVKFGAIDVGTNSIHLMMAEISPDGDFRVLGRDKEMVQLGKGGFAEHRLTERAINQGIYTLRRFLKMASLKGVTRIKAVATSAVREARNGGGFVSRVRDDLGLDLHVISAEEEARLIYVGVRHAANLGEQENLIIDVGGGSVEVIVGNAASARVLHSLKLGASRLAEVFVGSDPPTGEELKTMRRHIERAIATLVTQVGDRKFEDCIVTSGTVGNLATICAYRRGAVEIEPVTQLTIERDELKAMLTDLSALKREERMRVPGLDARRVDALIPASILLLCFMRAFDISRLRHCDNALREGIILDHIARNRAHLIARSTWPDPRTRSVVQLGERCGYRRNHTEQVARLAVQLFDQLAPLHRLDASYRGLLEYACLLHDIGYLISHENHHKHSYYLIRNGGLQGFTQDEIEIIANVARYHRKGGPKKSHYSYANLPKQHRPAVRRLIALIRMANALDRTHYSVVDSLHCRARKRTVDLVVESERDVELELWNARRVAPYFERVFDCRLNLVPPGGHSEDVKP